MAILQSFVKGMRGDFTQHEIEKIVCTIGSSGSFLAHGRPNSFGLNSPEKAGTTCMGIASIAGLCEMPFYQ